MKKCRADREKMMAEARSLDWIAQQLSNALNGRDIDPSQGYVAPLGYLLSSVVLQALAAETALKALQMLKLGYFVKSHDLLKLFKQLQPDMRDGISITHQTLVQAFNTENPTTINVKSSIEDVLRKHRRDFEEWRYVYELDDGASISLLDLRIATKALVLNFDAITFDPSIHDPKTYMANRMQGIVDT